MLDDLEMEQPELTQRRPVVGNFGQIISPAILTLLNVIMSVIMVIIMIITTVISTIKDTKPVLILHNLILRLLHKDVNKVRLSGNA